MIFRYIRVGLPSDDNRLEQARRDLKEYCELLLPQTPIHEVPYEDIRDVFLIELPQEDSDAFQLVNAIAAYCNLHNYHNHIEAEQITVPFDTFLKGLADE